MRPHVHTPSQKVETWGLNGMTSHLRHDHPEITLPMSWSSDLGKYHEAHLKAHQTPTEEQPVPMVPAPDQDRVNRPADRLPVQVRQVVSQLTDQIEAAAGPLWALVQDNERLLAELEETRQRLGAALEAGSILERHRDAAQADFQRVCRELQDAKDAARTTPTAAFTLDATTTGELLDEIRRRIDLGHCGLGYRPMYDDED